MILGSIRSWEQHRQYEHPAIAKAVEELIKLAGQPFSAGKVEIDGDKMYISVMEFDAKSAAEQVAEKHERYLDVQFLIEGTETQGWSPLAPDLTPSKDYNSDDDYALYTPQSDEQLFTLAPGDFVVYYPYDIHRPGMGEAGTRIRKAVAKIHIDLLRS